MKKITFFRILPMLIGISSAAMAQQNAQQSSDLCIFQLGDDPKIQIIAKKLPYDLSKPVELDALANDTKATTKERVALAYLNKEREKCLDIANDFRRENYPVDIQGLISSFRSDSVATLADLYGGKVTYGQANKLRAKQAVDFRQNLENLIQRYKSQEDAQNKQRLEAEARQRYAEQQERQRQDELEAQRQQFQAQQEAQAKANRRAEAQQQFNQGLQLLNSARPQFPASTLNNSIRCRSSAYGGVVTTNCD